MSTKENSDYYYVEQDVLIHWILSCEEFLDKHNKPTNEMEYKDFSIYGKLMYYHRQKLAEIVELQAEIEKLKKLINLDELAKLVYEKMNENGIELSRASVTPEMIVRKDGQK